MEASASDAVLTPVSPLLLGPGPTDAIAHAARLIAEAQRPVLLLGMMASEPRAAMAVRAPLRTASIPVGSVSARAIGSWLPGSELRCRTAPEGKRGTDAVHKMRLDGRFAAAGAHRPRAARKMHLIQETQHVHQRRRAGYSTS